MYTNRRQKICNIAFAVIFCVTAAVGLGFTIWTGMEAMSGGDNKYLVLLIPFEILLLLAALLDETMIFGCMKYFLRDKKDRTTVKTIFFAILLAVVCMLTGFAILFVAGCF